jgi:hypothetical protein
MDKILTQKSPLTTLCLRGEKGGNCTTQLHEDPEMNSAYVSGQD